MSKRDAFGKDFDPSSFDDVLELVDAWTRDGSTTASEIVERLRARGVVVRATTSGRHVIVQSPRSYSSEPPEARLFVMPTAPHHRMRQWLERAHDPAPRVHHVIRPPGQALHWVAELFSKRTRERVLDPIIADMQLEYCEELAAERPRRLRLWLVQVRAWVAFAEAIFLRTVFGRIIEGISRL